MKFRTWHIFIVLFILGLATAGISYAQAPAPSKVANTASKSEASKSAWKAGTTLYAAASAADHVAATHESPVVLSANLTVPQGMQADLIATFTGQVGDIGAQANEQCNGTFRLDPATTPLAFQPIGGYYIVDQNITYNGRFTTVTVQQYLTKVAQGKHTVGFVIGATDQSANCTVDSRSITVVANIHK